MNNDKNIVDQIADVKGETTKHYKYKNRFKDPVALANWIEQKKKEWKGEAKQQEKLFIWEMCTAYLLMGKDPLPELNTYLISADKRDE